MTVRLESRTQPKVLIATLLEPYDPISDTVQIAMELQKRLDSSNEDVNLITDLRNINVTFSDLIQGLAVAYKTPGSVFANPRLKSFTVGSDLLIQIGAKAVSEQEQYGRIPIKLHSSVESALQAIENEATH